MAAKKMEKDLSELFQEMSIVSYEAGSHFYAKPTHLVDPHNFYIMPFPFLFHLPKLSQAGKPLEATELKETMTVIYRSANPDVNKYFKIELDEYVRGMILSVNSNNECKIYAVDRGFVEENVTLDRIFHPAYQESLVVPSLVQRCKLYFCEPKSQTFSEDEIETFKLFMGNEKLSIVVKDSKEDLLTVIVYNSKPKDISTMLMLADCVYWVPPARNNLDSLPVKQTKPKVAYKHAQLNAGDTMLVRVQSGSSVSDFYVASLLVYDDYLRNLRDFTNYCKGLSDITAADFTSGTLVGVNDDSKRCYERGYILEVVGDKAKVKLVEWGSEIDVPKQKLKAIKSEVFIEPPVQAIYCSAEKGFVPWDKTKFFLKGFEFKITIKTVGEGFETPHIVAITKV